MKKIHIILLVVTVIIVLAVNSFLTTEALGDTQKDFINQLDRVAKNMPKGVFEPTTKEKIERVIPIVIMGIPIVIIVGIVIHYLEKIAKQQKEILESQNKNNKDHLKKHKQSINI